MPKVKPEYRQIDEDVSTGLPDLHTAVAQELAEREIVSQGPQVTHSEPETKEQQLARAEAKIRELFAEATTSGPPPPDDASSRLRREAISHLIAEGWKHTDAVKCADRVKILLDSEDDYSYQEALLVAQDECSPPAKAAPPPEIADDKWAPLSELPEVGDDEPEPLSEIPAGVGISSTVCGSRWHKENEDELAQILHNFDRDTARLRKLLGMEGVAKKRRPKEAKSG